MALSHRVKLYRVEALAKERLLAIIPPIGSTMKKGKPQAVVLSCSVRKEF